MNRATSWILALGAALAFGCAGSPASESAANGDPSPVALLEQARAIHERVLVLDAHADTELPDAPSPYVGDDGLSQVDPAKLHAGGVDAVVMSVAVGSGPRTPEGYAAARSRADQEVAAVLELAADPANNAVVARSADEIVAAHEQGEVALVLGFQNAMILGTDVSALNDFYEAGARVFALTHLGNNDFADSSRPVFDAATGTHEAAEHGGLSDLGVAAIERINALGGVVDVSQLSRDAALQVLEVSTAPVIASHSNARQLTDVSRNLSDEEIDGIGEIGGVIHVCRSGLPLRLGRCGAGRGDPGGAAQGRRPGGLPLSLRAVLGDRRSRRQVRLHAVDQRPPRPGQRGCHARPSRLHRRTDRRGPRRHRVRLQPRRRRRGVRGRQRGPGVTVGLLERGYSEEDVGKIWGGNFLRVLRAAEAGKSSAE